MSSSSGAKKKATAQAKPGLIRRLLVLGLLSGVLIWLTPIIVERSLDLWDRPVKEVAIEGEFTLVAREQIADLLADNIRTGFWKIDIQALQVALESDPWIASVAIRRRWPDKLVVEVQEQTPIARWGDRGFVNNRAELILVAGVAGKLDHLPMLEAEDRALGKLMQNYQTIAELMGSRNLRLAHIRLDSRGSWRVTLMDGAKVFFGRHRLQERMRLFAKVYDLRLAEHWSEVASVDVRYNNGAAVGWRSKG